MASTTIHTLIHSISLPLNVTLAKPNQCVLSVFQAYSHLRLHLSTYQSTYSRTDGRLEPYIFILKSKLQTVLQWNPNSCDACQHVDILTH